MTRQHPARDLLIMPEEETYAVCEPMVEEDRVLIEADWGEYHACFDNLLAPAVDTRHHLAESGETETFNALYT